MDKYEAKLAELNKVFTIHSFVADHAFANPTSSRFDQQAAEDAFHITINFLQQHL